MCAGKVLTSYLTLSEQKVTNGSTVMVLIMLQTMEAAQRESDTFDRIHKIRTDAELLINDCGQSNFLDVG